MELLPKQEEAVYFLKNDYTTEIIYGGAAGGGKSALGCLWLIEMCQNHPNTRWLMGRSKLKTLKETTLKTFFELSNKLEITDQFTFNAQSNIIYWNNGSEIILKDLFLYPSDPNFDSLGSLEITGAFIDECNQIVYKSWQVVKSRIRFKLDLVGGLPKILGTCNPSKNWVYKQFYKPNKSNQIKKYRAFVQSLPTDNPHLPQSYLDSLMQLDKNSRQRLYFGNWEYDDDPSTLISHDAIQDYFNGNHIEKGDKKYITCDVARKGKDKTIIRVWYGWVCVERYSYSTSLINDVVNILTNLQQRHKITNSNVIVDEDGVGGGVVDYANVNGFVNNSKALMGENYTNLKSQCSIRMASKIQQRETTELCKDNSIIDLISEEMEQVKIANIDKDTKLAVIGKDEIKNNIGRSPDDWDSIMMRYWFELTIEPAFY